MNNTMTTVFARRMRKAHGELPSETCRRCCNCQKKDRKSDIKVCIAYCALEEWDENEKACGYFNVPFNGIRPRERELFYFYNKPKKKEVNENQMKFQNLD